MSNATIAAGRRWGFVLIRSVAGILTTSLLNLSTIDGASPIKASRLAATSSRVVESNPALPYG
ncbi:MAG TPA: hypothetical protein VFN25_07605 [Dokdonella sp.]|uniref:hypothetical protein n=1 Tax=Dokdonella sp. TaxID=2291710 RepID=UPI002D7F20D1|nr:hypothetical protein [Dokdonella sp.]HET9032754.1 hypothetical protein [Dokdonella sp.]